MNFLLDHDVYAVTGRFLSGLGHDVVTVAEIGLTTASDEALLALAHDQNRLMVTCDRDYGSLVFLRDFGAGVIYLRIRPSLQNDVHAQLTTVLDLYTQEQMSQAFIVVEADGYRVRHLSNPDDPLLNQP